MVRPKNFRTYFLVAVLGISGLIVLLREHRPSFLRPDLHLCAYVTTADGSVTVVDLVRLKAVARIAVGPGLSGMREHPSRPEIFGVSTTGGYVWVLDPRANHFTGQVTARIAVGPLPYSLDFSPDGNRVYTTASGNNTLVVIDAARFSVNHDERIVAGRRRVHTVTIGRKVQRVGKRPHGDSRRHLSREVIGAWIKDPHVPARRANAKNLRPRRMFPHSRKSWPNRNTRHSFKPHQINHRDAAVCGRDVRAEMQVRPQERRPMLAQQDDQPGDTQHGNQEIGAKVLRTNHVGDGILPWFDERSNAARLSPTCGTLRDGCQQDSGELFPTNQPTTVLFLDLSWLLRR